MQVRTARLHNFLQSQFPIFHSIKKSRRPEKIKIWLFDKFIQYFTSVIQSMWIDGAQDSGALEAASR